ncbi:MAG: hypothetical protein JXQ83_13255 [Candidatus Glassbacteria bacterium]|nr:hypothetical protein [Candidatus Glassbacteria bacterium]
MKKLSFIKEDEMLKSSRRKRRKTSPNSPWKKAKDFFLARPGVLKEAPLPVPEPDSTDWLICPHDTTSGLGVRRGTQSKPSGKTPANIF